MLGALAASLVGDLLWEKAVLPLAKRLLHCAAKGVLSMFVKHTKVAETCTVAKMPEGQIAVAFYDGKKHVLMRTKESAFSLTVGGPTWAGNAASGQMLVELLPAGTVVRLIDGNAIIEEGPLQRVFAGAMEPGQVGICEKGDYYLRTLRGITCFSNVALSITLASDSRPIAKDEGRPVEVLPKGTVLTITL